MGGDSSKEENSQLTTEQGNYFLLEHYSMIELKQTKLFSYYCIDPQMSITANKIVQLRSYFKLDQFPTIDTFKQELNFYSNHQTVKIITTINLPPTDFAYLQSENKVSQIFLFQGDQSKALELKKSYSKIKSHSSNIDSLIKQLKQHQKKEEIFIPLNSLLFLVEKDTKKLNKYRLNYFCLTARNGRAQAKQDFLTLSKHLYPEDQNISIFEKEYNIEIKQENLIKQVQEWVSKDSFYWKLTHLLPQTTSDPKKLAYLRLPFQDIYWTIREAYKKIEPKAKKVMYIVLSLNEEEQKNLQKSQFNFLLFTSFVKGFKSQSDAKKYAKTIEGAFIFDVEPNRGGQLEEKYDFGYMFLQGSSKENVIFNIYNIFRIDQINMMAKRCVIFYGGLAQAYRARKERNNLAKDAILEKQLLRNLDFLQDQMENFDGQASLLQMQGNFKDSLQIYEKKEDFIRKSNSSEAQLKCSLQKGDALKINSDYLEAEKEYLSAKNGKFNINALIKLAELYQLRNQEENLSKILIELEVYVKDIKYETQKIKALSGEDRKHFQQIIKADNLLATRDIKKGKAKKAWEKLQTLKEALADLYVDDLEGRPLVHNVHKNLAICKNMLGQPTEALGLLKQVREWQIVCEGNTPNVALTETMIQSVSQSSGSLEQLENSKSRLKKINESVEPMEMKYLLQSNAAFTLNQSMISIQL